MNRFKGAGGRVFALTTQLVTKGLVIEGLFFTGMFIAAFWVARKIQQR